MLENVTKFNTCFKLMRMAGFGERLRRHRDEKNVSGWRIEKETGLSRQNLSNIEKGRRPASEDVLQKLASIPELDITYETLKAWQALDAFPPGAIKIAAQALEYLEKHPKQELQAFYKKAEKEREK